MDLWAGMDTSPAGMDRHIQSTAGMMKTVDWYFLLFFLFRSPLGHMNFLGFSNAGSFNLPCWSGIEPTSWRVEMPPIWLGHSRNSCRAGF